MFDLRSIPIRRRQQAAWLRAHAKEQAEKRRLADQIPPELTMGDHLVAFIDILEFRREIAAAITKGPERLYQKIRIVQREFEKAGAALRGGSGLRS